MIILRNKIFSIVKIECINGKIIQLDDTVDKSGMNHKLQYSGKRLRIRVSSEPINGVYKQVPANYAGPSTIKSGWVVQEK